MPSGPNNRQPHLMHTLPYTKAIMLLTQTQAAMRDAIVQEQFAHLELLLRRIGLPAE
jgi:hypothetical protein